MQHYSATWQDLIHSHMKSLLLYILAFNPRNAPDHFMNYKTIILMEILENRKRISDIKKKKNWKIEKTNIFMENPKARNKKESKPKSNLNLSSKKTQ